MSRPCLYSLQDFTINGSLIATATSSVPGDRKSSKSSAIHPPQPSLDTPTFLSELYDFCGAKAKPRFVELDSLNQPQHKVSVEYAIPCFVPCSILMKLLQPKMKG